MKVFATTIAAGETFVGGAGNFLMLVATTAAVTVKFLGLDGNDLDLTGEDVEAGYKAFIENGFATYQVTSATTQTVRIGVSRGRDIGAYDRAIGSVDVLTTPTVVLPDVKPDWPKIYTEGDNYFSRGWSEGAVAAKYSSAQLYNPAGSGVVLALRHAAATLSGPNRALMAILTGASGSTPLAMISANNRNINAAAPLGIVYVNSSATLLNLYDVNSELVMKRNTYGVADFAFAYESPILIPEGAGVVMVGNVVNTNMSGHFTWSEH